MEQTIGQELQWSTEHLTAKGIETARLDSEALLAHILKIDRTKLFLENKKSLSATELLSFKNFVERRANREPLHYIIENREFWSLPFKVNSQVLIPRPETEILIQKTLATLKKSYSNHKGLIYINDIGTGSGNIAISLSKEWYNLRVVATDSSGDALSVAAENARLNNISSSIDFQKKELFGELKTDTGANNFDIIVSNPPYIPSDEIETLAPEIKNFEPVAALDGGKDGLDYYRKIIAGAPDYLNINSSILFEIGHNQGKTISKMLTATGRFSEIEITKDYSGNDRVIAANSL